MSVRPRRQDRRHRLRGRRAVGQQGRGVDRVVPRVDAGGRERGRPRGAHPQLGELALADARHEPLAVGEHHRRERGDDEQRRGDLEDPDVAAEDQHRDALHVAALGGVGCVESDRGPQARPTEPDDEQQPEADPGDDRRKPLVRQRLDERVARVDADHHQDEEEEHHHGAGVDDDLDDAEEDGALQDVEERQGDHDEREPQRAVHGLAAPDHRQGAEHGDDGEDPERDLLRDARRCKEGAHEAASSPATSEGACSGTACVTRPS